MTMDSADARNTAAMGSRGHHTLATSLTPGLLIMTVGVILLAYQLQWVSAGTLWKFWPVALILAGVSELESWWREQQ